MKRKYLTEFGLHVYSSHGTIFYPSDIPHLKFKENFHIYMINLIPKIYFNIDSLVQYKDHISINMILKTTEDTREENIKFTLGAIDHKSLSIDSEQPFKTLKIMYPSKRCIALRSLFAYTQFSINRLETEVIYIGQSYGKDGSRKALDRLKSHSTLQKILADLVFKEEQRDVAITLWEFSPGWLSSMDGISKSYQTTDLEDKEHILKVFREGHKYDQIINITEAALIHYFKPEYNEKFKNNFPLITHNGYKHYYDLDYNSIIVEIDQDTINGCIYSKYRPYKFFHDIRYTLNPENIRKSMFDIFSTPNDNS
jgi:hypothetical protein